MIPIDQLVLTYVFALMFGVYLAGAFEDAVFPLLAGVFVICTIVTVTAAFMRVGGLL